MMPAEFVVSRPCKWGKKTDPWGLTNGRKSIGTDVATSCPAGIGTVRVRTKLLLGVDGALASARGGDQRRRGTRGLGTGIGRLCAGGTEWLVEEACKGFGGFGTLARWWGQCGWRGAHCRSGVWPQHMEHEAQPEKRDQEKFVENWGGFHDEALSHGVKEGYLTRFSDSRIIRLLKVHDRRFWYHRRGCGTIRML